MTKATKKCVDSKYLFTDALFNIRTDQSTFYKELLIANQINFNRP